MEQVKDAITIFGEIVSGTVSSPSEQHLLPVNEESEKLTECMRDIFGWLRKSYCILKKGHGPTLISK